MMLVSMGIKAQSVVGAWAATQEEDGMNMAIILGLDKANNSIVKLLVEVKEDEVGTINVEATCEGTYTFDGSTLKLQIDENNTTVGLGDIEWSESMKQAFAAKPELETTIRSSIEGAMQEQMGSMKAGIKELSQLTVVSISENSMDLKAMGDDEIITFNKVQP